MTDRRECDFLQPEKGGKRMRWQKEAGFVAENS